MRRSFRIACGKEPGGHVCTVWLWFWRFAWLWNDIPPIRWAKKVIVTVYYCWRDARGLPIWLTCREMEGKTEPRRCLLCGRPEMPAPWMPLNHPDSWGHRVYNPNRERPDRVCAHHKAWFGADIVDCDTNIQIPSDDLSEKGLYCLDVMGDELTYWINAVLNTVVLLARRWRYFFRKNLPPAW
jgi:hypothetical protein